MLDCAFELRALRIQEGDSNIGGWVGRRPQGEGAHEIDFGLLIWYRFVLNA